jgi:hypothetical protein
MCLPVILLVYRKLRMKGVPMQGGINNKWLTAVDN